MRKFLKAFGMLLGVSLLSLPAIAQAQTLTLRLEPGLALPLTNPQAERFDAGGALSVKPELGIGSYFSLGPSLSVVSFHSGVEGIGAPTEWGAGGFIRLKRPHDAKNTGRGLTAVSPWVDGDLMYVRTDPLDRFGWAVAGGASVPTSDNRWLWVGPFVRYQGVHQDPGVFHANTNDAKTLILGVSFEFGASTKKEVSPTPCPPPVVVVQNPPPAPPPPTVYRHEEIELKQVVQFAWDSPVLDTTAQHQLSDVVSKLSSSENFQTIKVEGHASSDGQVEHNNILSQKRAQSVVDFLVAHGIAREKLSATGFGSRVPVATNKTQAGRVLNRRAEFVVKFVIVKEVK